MQPDDDRAIFEAGSQPEPEATDPIALPEDRTAEDIAVSQAIHGLQHSRSDRHTPPPPPPPAARPGAAPGADLDGIDDKSNAGLLKALLDERDRRQAAEQSAKRYETYLNEQRGKTDDQRPPLSQRLFEDPEGTLAELREQWIAPLRQEMQQDKINNDFARSHERHGETFAEAWQAWYSQVEGGKDPNSYFAVMNAPSPGEAMVAWHRRRQRDEVVGDDLDAFKQKVIDEYLGRSGGAPPLPRASDGRFQPRPQAQRLPTAVSRMGSAGKGISSNAESMDGSDAAIFAAGRPPRRSER